MGFCNYLFKTDFILYWTSKVILFWWFEKNLTICNSIYVFRIEQEIELQILEEETARRIEEAIRAKVEEKLESEEVKLEIERRVEEGHKKLFDDVEAQLEREKQAALTEARQKEVITLFI